jgi:hypothetical protein
MIQLVAASPIVVRPFAGTTISWGKYTRFHLEP